MQFMVKKDRVLTPHADYCLPGITRATVREKKIHILSDNIFQDYNMTSLIF